MEAKQENPAEQTSNVIDIATRQPITEYRYSQAEAETLIEKLIQHELSTTSLHEATPLIIDDLITMIENNSGVSRVEIMEKIYKGVRA